MLLSYSWLQSYLPKLPTASKLADVMMLHGLDVEGIHDTASNFDHVVVGEIVGIKPHPNADKLRLAEVIITPNGEPQEIVCGAPNIEVGQRVPVALIGATLPNGLTIEPRAIRGVTSNGMLCAADELGLGHDHSGILVLDPQVTVGTLLAEVLGSTDTVIDVTTPANRADLMSMRGLAWEIGAMLGQKPVFPTMHVKESTIAASDSIAVAVVDAKLCPLFTVCVIRGLRSQPTPPHIVQRLSAAGMRSINLVVDITNYIMLEFGQPLHAYDAKKIAGGKLTVRAAQSGERLVTLDNHARTLSADMVVIADENSPVGLAGVMGGRDTEVTATTTDIILEAAIFNSVSIRQTSRRLGLVSEASKRFEKGLWPDVTLAALNAAAAMIAELGGGSVEQGIVSTGMTSTEPRTVSVTPTYIAERIGQKIPATTSKKILQQLGFLVRGTAKQWEVTVPTWRLDVALPEDIVDEVGRMLGYDELPTVDPETVKQPPELPAAIRFREEVKNILVDMGFTEVISHAFYGAGKGKFVQGQHYTVANPLDATQELLRKSLRPQVADILAQQADAGQDAKVFELGIVFDPTLPGEIDRQQQWKLAVGVCNKSKTSVDTFLPELQSKLNTSAVFEGRMDSAESIRGRDTSVVEYDLATLMKKSKPNFGPWDPRRHVAQNIKVREMSKYPAVTRDISFWWPKREEDIFACIEALNLELLRSVVVADRFEKNGQTSYKITCRYQSDERTLMKQEVDVVEQAVKQALIAQGGTIR